MQMPARRFHGFRYTVDLAAYRRWREITSLPPAPKRAARYLLKKLFEWYQEFPDTVLEKIDVFYDRNEAFLRHVHSDWRDKKLRKRYPVLDLVNTVAPANSRLTPPLQAADMLAWSCNRLLVGPRDEQVDKVCASVLGSTGMWSVDLNADVLQKMYGRILLPSPLVQL